MVCVGPYCNTGRLGRVFTMVPAGRRGVLRGNTGTCDLLFEGTPVRRTVDISLNQPQIPFYYAYSSPEDVLGFLRIDLSQI